jgi:hypothetical protein
MSDLRDRLIDALRNQDEWDLFTPEAAVDVLLSLPGIAVVDMANQDDEDDPRSQTEDYQAGWHRGYGHGVREGLCRAARVSREAINESLQRAGWKYGELTGTVYGIRPHKNITPEEDRQMRQVAEYDLKKMRGQA